MFVVFDLDGTLADDSSRSHFMRQHPKDYDSYHDAGKYDEAIWPVLATMHALAEVGGHRIEIWTGRPEKYRHQTLVWLEQRGVYYDRLRMRPDGDFRSTQECKGEWMEENKPDLVFDDRTQAVKFWRDNGIVCLQVQDHDF